MLVEDDDAAAILVVSWRIFLHVIIYSTVSRGGGGGQTEGYLWDAVLVEDDDAAAMLVVSWWIFLHVIIYSTVPGEGGGANRRLPVRCRVGRGRWRSRHVGGLLADLPPRHYVQHCVHQHDYE